MWESLSFYLWIGLGSGLGGISRFWMSGWVANHFGETFPWGTVMVNVLGSFFIGLVAALTGPEGRILWSPRVSQFFMAGVCGGFTTFSSFSLQTLNLLREGEWFGALANMGLSLILCLLAVFAGHVTGQLINR